MLVYRIILVLCWLLWGKRILQSVSVVIFTCVGFSAALVLLLTTFLSVVFLPVLTTCTVCTVVSEDSVAATAVIL